MFFRRVVTKRNGKKYVYLKLIETYRESGKIKQRVIANLGNINNLNPEKVNALISSLNKLTDPSIIVEELPPQEHGEPYFQIDELHHTWNKLGLSDFLCRAQPPKCADKFPWLIKAMVFQRLLFPSEHRPIAVSYPALKLPELEGCEIPGTDFYRAAAALAGIKKQLEAHLFNILTRYLEKPSLLYISQLHSEYAGNKCDINAAGTAYQIRSYRLPLNLLIVIFPPDIPLGCSVYDKNVSAGEIIAFQQDIEKSMNTKTCLVIDKKSGLDATLSKPDVFFIKSLSPKEFASIPVSTKDLWQDKDAFTVNNTLWVKNITKPSKRYIICHDLRPNAASDQALEQNLSQAANELDKIQSLVKQRRLRREKTILNKIAKILERYGCQDYFDFRLNLEKQEIQYSRKEEVINKVKTIQRTQVLETNLRALPALDIVTTFHQYEAFKKSLQFINDLIKIPVIYPYNKFQYSKDCITGQALIHLLGLIMKKLVSKNLNG